MYIPPVSPIAPTAATSAVATDTPAGSWRGYALAVDPQIDLLDSAEERSVAAAEHLEPHTLHERKIHERQRPLLPQLQAIELYLDLAGQPDQQEKFRQFVLDLKDLSRRNGRAGVGEEAQRRFADDVEQFMALAYASAELRDTPQYAALRDEVDGALDELHARAGVAIDQGLRAVAAAAPLGRDDPAANARYRDAVVGGASLTDLLDGALQRFGVPNYKEAVLSLMKALGADLHLLQGAASLSPRLQAVLQELYQLEVLSTVLEGCQQLAARLLAQHGLQPPPSSLLHSLISTSNERWVSDERFDQIAAQHGAQSTPQRIALLSGLKELLRRMPDKVFADQDARLGLLMSAQGALDQAIAEEDQHASAN